VPVGLGAETGLPVGVELDGPADCDRRLLEIGMGLEDLFGTLPLAEGRKTENRIPSRRKLR
jgi:indoleacetamide hydrolase